MPSACREPKPDTRSITDAYKKKLAIGSAGRRPAGKQAGSRELAERRRGWIPDSGVPPGSSFLRKQ